MDKNQTLNTTQGLWLFSLLGFVVMLTLALVSEGFVDPQLSDAESSAKSLALQLNSGGLQAMDSSLEDNAPAKDTIRGVAAVQKPYDKSLDLFGRSGRIGKDPWGNAYHYLFVENSQGQARAIVVWSNGPNSHKETSAQELEKAGLLQNGKIQFSGDDLGYALLL